MEKFFQRVKTKPRTEDVGSSFNPNISAPSVTNNGPNLEEFPADPGLRRAIYEYDVNIREKVRRTYLQRGPFQPKNHDFPWSQLGVQKRRFISTWFNDYKPWLEYSIAKDAAFCLPCYLFKSVHGRQGGADVFSGEGFRNWKKKDKFTIHVGEHDSNHNKCMRACEDLMYHRQLIWMTSI
ncbi:hypothetical protein DCAR_0623529 [Daucus carota subsp. sativus]|uniref:TTF-type domain-containing protein n=1 Tax=Daucus carota subsp. sativus TaxID=79200 RepID=A0AAF0X9D7_DAUCS|nr:hypothetical protein DCAR_0623529 [Daucus carota subsp. sativus]